MITILFVAVLAGTGFAQTPQAFGAGASESAAKGLLDPARFDIHHAISFGAASSTGSEIKSQSLYSTMIQYEFAKPVTLNLNFGLPIHSTFNQYQNLNSQNIQSLDYMRSMPWDVSLSWQPRENLFMRLSVVRRTFEDDYNSGFFGHGLYPYRSRSAQTAGF